MAAEKHLNGVGVRRVRAGDDHGLQELKEFRPRMSWKTIHRVGHNICVYPLRQVKPDGHPSRIGVRIVVRDKRQTRRIGKSHRNRRALTTEMRRCG